MALDEAGEIEQPTDPKEATHQIRQGWQQHQHHPLHHTQQQKQEQEQEREQQEQGQQEQQQEEAIVRAHPAPLAIAIPSISDCQVTDPQCGGDVAWKQQQQHQHQHQQQDQQQRQQEAAKYHIPTVPPPPSPLRYDSDDEENCPRLLPAPYDARASGAGDEQRSQFKALDQGVLAAYAARRTITGPAAKLHPSLRAMRLDDSSSANGQGSGGSRPDNSKFTLRQKFWLVQMVQLRKMWRFKNREGAQGEWAKLAIEFNQFFGTHKDGKALQTHFKLIYNGWADWQRPGAQGSGTQPEDHLHRKNGEVMQEEVDFLRKVDECCGLWQEEMEGREEVKEKAQEKKQKRLTTGGMIRQGALEKLVKACKATSVVGGDLDCWSNLGRCPPRPGGGGGSGGTKSSDSSNSGNSAAVPKPHNKRSTCGQACEKIDRCTCLLERVAEGKKELAELGKRIALQTERAAMTEAIMIGQQRGQQELFVRVVEEQERQRQEMAMLRQAQEAHERRMERLMHELTQLVRGGGDEVVHEKDD